jgi:5'-nucleotidase
VIYSGTVAAAMEGRFLGLPAIAVSLVGQNPSHFDTAAEAVKHLIRRLLEHPLPPDTILNVNVPDLPWAQIEGFEATRLGHRHRAEQVVRGEDPRGRPLFWIGPAGPEQDAGPGTDFHAVRHNRVAVTPIQVDLTRHNAVQGVAEWLDGAPR